MKIPRLLRINKIPFSHIKGEGCKILERISGRFLDTTSSGPVPERRTIQSLQISTISSLVDRNMVSSVVSLENPIDNRGNYLPKSNRKNEITLNVQPLSPISHVPAVLQSTDIYHEKFLPCSRQEFNPTPCYHRNNTNDQQINTSIKTYLDLDSGNLKYVEPSSAAPGPSTYNTIAPPPRRKKLSTVSSQEMLIGENKITFTKSTKTKHAPRPPIRSLKQNATSKNVEDHFKFAKRTQSVQNFPTFCDQTTSEFNISKNNSELYRIADMRIHIDRSVDSDTALTINSPQSVGVATLKKNRRSEMKHVSSTDSVNIFEPVNNDVFSDFIDALSFEPVVSVLHDKDCDTEKCSKNIILNCKNVEKLPSKNLFSDSKLAVTTEQSKKASWVSKKNDAKTTPSTVYDTKCLFENSPPELPISSFTTEKTMNSSISRNISTLKDPSLKIHSINKLQSVQFEKIKKVDSISSIHTMESLNNSGLPAGNKDVRNRIKLSSNSNYDSSNKIKITTRSVYMMNLFTV